MSKVSSDWNRSICHHVTLDFHSDKDTHFPSFFMTPGIGYLRLVTFYFELLFIKKRAFYGSSWTISGYESLKCWSSKCFTLLNKKLLSSKRMLKKTFSNIWPNVWEHSGSVNWQHKINQYIVVLIFTFLFYEYSSLM